MIENMFEDAKTPREAIFQALGAASVCWENIDRAGIFESNRAKKIGEDLIDKLSEFVELDWDWSADS